MLTVGMHNVAIFTILLLVLLYQIILEGTPQHGRLWFACYTVILFCGCLGDGYVLYYFSVPAVLVSALHLIRGQKKNDWRILLATIGASAGGWLVPRLLNRFGFLQTQSAGSDLVPLSEIGNYLLNTLNTWLLIFGFDLGKITISPLPAVFAIVGAVCALIVLIAAVVALIRFFEQPAWVQVLVLSFGAVFGSFTLTTVTRAEPAVRYLSPAFYSGILLAAWQLDSLTAVKQRGKRLASLVSVLFLLMTAANISLQCYSSPQNDWSLIEVADSLRARGVDRVYATYWETHALNYYAEGVIEAAPIQALNEEIVPYRWSSKSDWYTPVYGASGVILSKSKRYGINEALLESQFGIPAERLELKDVLIWFYDSNLSEMIENME